MFGIGQCLGKFIFAKQNADIESERSAFVASETFIIPVSSRARTTINASVLLGFETFIGYKLGNRKTRFAILALSAGSPTDGPTAETAGRSLTNE